MRSCLEARQALTTTAGRRLRAVVATCLVNTGHSSAIPSPPHSFSAGAGPPFGPDSSAYSGQPLPFVGTQGARGTPLFLGSPALLPCGLAFPFARLTPGEAAVNSSRTAATLHCVNLSPSSQRRSIQCSPGEREDRRPPAAADEGTTGVVPRCTECGAEAGAEPFLCSACGTLLPLDHSHDFFQLFGIEPEYHINTVLLEQRYKALQRQLHPDKFASSDSKVDQERSAEWSAHVIGAYYTLLRPLSRARYLLRGKIGESFEKDESTVDDQELLMEIMEARERVEQASPEELHDLRAEFEEQLRLLGDEFALAYEKGKHSVCRGLVHRITYCTRILQEISARS